MTQNDKLKRLREWVNENSLSAVDSLDVVERKPLLRQIDRLLAEPEPAPPAETQPNPGVIRIDRAAWSVADGVEITADEALKRLGKNPADYGVWERGTPGSKSVSSDEMLRGWDKLSRFHTYFTAPKIINAGQAERELLAVAAHIKKNRDQCQEDVDRHAAFEREVDHDLALGSVHGLSIALNFTRERLAALRAASKEGP